MERYDPILFDLDGTLTDPGQGIRNSVAFALSKCGISVDDIYTLNKFIGPPLQESFQNVLDFPRSRLTRRWLGIGSTTKKRACLKTWYMTVSRKCLQN